MRVRNEYYLVNRKNETKPASKCFPVDANISLWLHILYNTVPKMHIDIQPREEAVCECDVKMYQSYSNH